MTVQRVCARTNHLDPVFAGEKDNHGCALPRGYPVRTWVNLHWRETGQCPRARLPAFQGTMPKPGDGI